MNDNFENDLRGALSTLAREAVPVSDEPVDALPTTQVVVPLASRRRRRTWGIAAAAAIVALSLGAVAVVGHDARHTDPQVQMAPAGSTNVARAPIGGRSDMAAVYTGSDVLIWGGRKVNGAARPPDTSTADTSDAPAPSDAVLNDGAVYTVATNTWHKMSAAPIEGRIAPIGVWTGHEMIVFGGGSATGAAYDPAHDAWRRIAAAPTNCLDFGTWSGAQLIAVGDCQSSKGPLSSYAYDPATDTWTRLPAPPEAPSGLITVGTRVVGFSYAGNGYVLSADHTRWTPLPVLPSRADLLNGLVAADSNALIVVSANSRNMTVAVLDRFDFTTNKWSAHYESTVANVALFGSTPLIGSDGVVAWPGDGVGPSASTSIPNGKTRGGDSFSWFNSRTGRSGTGGDVGIRLDRQGEAFLAIGHGRYFVWGGMFTNQPAPSAPDGAIFELGR